MSAACAWMRERNRKRGQNGPVHRAGGGASQGQSKGGGTHSTVMLARSVAA